MTYEEAVDVLKAVLEDGARNAQPIYDFDADGLARAAAEAIGLREMMDALEFYGDSGNWHIPVVSGSHVVVDGGFKAREAMRKG